MFYCRCRFNAKGKWQWVVGVEVTESGFNLVLGYDPVPITRELCDLACHIVNFIGCSCRLHVGCTFWPAEFGTHF